MSLLTEQELFDALDADIEGIPDRTDFPEDWESIKQVAAVIEAAVIKKLAAVKVKPFAYEIHTAMCEPELSYQKAGIKSLMQPLYTATAIAAARVQALEEAARTCRDMKQECGGPDSMQACLNRQMMSCSDAIRALIGGKQE